MNLIFSNISILNVGMAVVWIGLLICSITTFAVIIERFIYFQQLQIKEKSFVEKIDDLILKGTISEAVGFCNAINSPLSNIIRIGLVSKENIHDKMLAQSNREIIHIERFVSVLSTISTVAPLLGLLGTILGMIEAFAVIAIQETGQSEALANGISNALLTTAAGLIIAIPSVIMYNYFVNKVNTRISYMENISDDIAENLIKMGQI